MRCLRENSLSLVLLTLFAVSLLGQALAGWHSYNEQRYLHHDPVVTLRTYLASGTFVSATFENWESEFLQMGVLVLLTVYLRQKGGPWTSTRIRKVGRPCACASSSHLRYEHDHEFKAHSTRIVARSVQDCVRSLPTAPRKRRLARCC